MKRFEDAIPLEILGESQPWTSRRTPTLDPRSERLTVHPLGFRLSGEIKNGWRECSLVRRERYGSSGLLAGCLDDQWDVNNRAGQVRRLMLVHASFEALSVIGGHDYGRVLQFGPFF